METGNRPRRPSRSKTKNTNRLDMDLKEILREEALRYLPAKALHRSLSVCRDWKLQISAPFFVHKQSVSFRSISGLFIQSPSNPPSFLSLEPLAYGVPDPELKFLPEPVYVKASCNGLLCCQGQAADMAYYICNPVNQQWKKLPKPSVDHGSNSSIVLVFEPSLLNFVAEYKVICIYASPDIEEALEFEIYSSDKDAWKVCGEMYFAKSTLQLNGGIYMNGMAYWSTSSGKVICFDVKKERATETYGYGYGYGYNGYGTTLGSMNGKLCTGYMHGLSLSVNVLNNAYAKTQHNIYGAAWASKYKSNLVSADIKVGVCDRPWVLLIWDDVVVFQAGKWVYCYHLKLGTATVLCNDANYSSGSLFLPYVNSLVCLA